MRLITKQEIIQELYGVLAMCDGFADVTHAGGNRQKEMQKYLPHQIASRIMSIQKELENSELLGDVSAKKCSCDGIERACSNFPTNNLTE